VKGFVGSSLIALICIKYSAIISDDSWCNIISQMYRIFINDGLLILSNKQQKTANHPNEEKFNSSITELSQAVQLLIDGTENSIVIECEDLQEKWNEFKSRYRFIAAAGGLVFNAKNELLMIHRLGRWDLPKGKIEPGESVEEGAVREVCEECGLKNVKLEEELTSTYHTYTMKGVDVLKRTYWFRMKSNDQKLIPQTDEGIQSVVWQNHDQVQKALENTYSSIEDLIGTYFNFAQN